jgi:site-specific recombinase XerC
MEGKQLLIAQVLYGAGLRLMELARLRVKEKLLLSSLKIQRQDIKLQG